MNGAEKAACRVAVLILLFALTLAPAKAQFGGGAGGGDMMTQMAPMLEMMKAKMGKRRFGQMMQTMGPMMGGMMENGGGGAWRHDPAASVVARALHRKVTAWAWAAATSWACSAVPAAAT